MSPRSSAAVLLLVALAAGAACYAPPDPAPRRAGGTRPAATTARGTAPEVTRVATGPAAADGPAATPAGGVAPGAGTDVSGATPGTRAAGPARVEQGTLVRSVAFPTGDPASSAVLLETRLPEQVVAERPFTYTILVRNLTDRALAHVVVTDAQPDGFERTGATPTPSGETDGRVRWDLDRLGPGATRTIEIAGRATRMGALRTCARVLAASEVCNATEVVQPALELVARAPAEVLLCDPIPLDLVVTNPGTGTVRDVEIVAELPDGLAAPDGARSVRLRVASLGAGEQRALTADVRASRVGTYRQRGTASAADGLSATSGTVTTRVRQPVLALTKTGRDVQYIGRELSYELTVTNTGDGEATDVVLRDVLPGDAAFVRASDGGRLSGGAVSWELGTLAPGGSRTVSVVLRAGAAGLVRNAATASAHCAEDAGAEVETQVRGVPAILLEVVDVEDPVEVGANETYLVTVTNQGSAPGTNIVVTATAPPQMTLLEARGPVSGTIDGATATFAPLPSLGPGQQVEFRLEARAEAAGDVRFAVRMTSDQLGSPVSETEATNLY